MAVFYAKLLPPYRSYRRGCTRCALLHRQVSPVLGARFYPITPIYGLVNGNLSPGPSAPLRAYRRRALEPRTDTATLPGHLADLHGARTRAPRHRVLRVPWCANNTGNTIRRYDRPNPIRAIAVITIAIGVIRVSLGGGNGCRCNVRGSRTLLGAPR